MNQTTVISSKYYRPEIDGLRAIAVIAVVLYHAEIGCPGGFVGVDVFFVISGFLITSIILRDLREQKFSMVEFWERRVRRIFPALSVCVLAILFTGYFLLLPTDLKSLGNSAVAQAVFCANIYFWRTTNYFDGANTEKPLLHTWSLAVEEQFYFFLPILLIIVFRSRRLREPSSLVLMCMSAMLVSFLVAVWGVKHQPFATFFLLPTRVWELLCGALIAVIPLGSQQKSRLVRESVSWLSLALIIAPICGYNDQTPFPGVAAIPPCLGTALLIWVNTNVMNSVQSGVSFAAQLLSMRWMTFVGLISYSLYLWHWPVIAFCSYWKAAPFTLADKWLLVCLSLIFGSASCYFIEIPFRYRRFCQTRRRLFGAMAIASAVGLFAATALSLSDGFSFRIPETARRVLAEIERDETQLSHFTHLIGNTDASKEDWLSNLPRMGSHAKDGHDFIVLGDSHAQFALPTFDAISENYGLSGTAVTYQGTPPLIGWPHRDKLAAPDPRKLWEGALTYVRDHDVKVTFLFGYWSSYQREFDPQELQKCILNTMQLFSDAGSKVYLVADVPTYNYDILRAELRNQMFPLLASNITEIEYDQHVEMNSVIYDILRSEPNVLDPSCLLLDAVTNVYRHETESGAPLYFDGNHLTQTGVRTALGPLLNGVFADYVKRRDDANITVQTVLSN